jgi:hypothetical protein
MDTSQYNKSFSLRRDNVYRCQTQKGIGARLIELASAKKWLLFASMFLAVLSALAQFTPIVAVYLLIVELAHHARDLNAIDSSYVWTLGLVSWDQWPSMGSCSTHRACSRT